MTDALRRHHLRADMDTLLFWRALHALDSAAVKAPDHFDLISELRLFFDEHRGGPISRLAEALSDPHRQATLASLRLELPERLRELLLAAAGGRPWRPDEAESEEQLRFGNSGAQAIAAAILSVAAVTLLHAPGLATTVSTALACLATIWILLALSRVRA
jgi:hypothetical protein